MTYWIEKEAFYPFQIKQNQETAEQRTLKWSTGVLYAPNGFGANRRPSKIRKRIFKNETLALEYDLRSTNTDVWQAIVARATESRKNCSNPAVFRTYISFSR